MSVNMKKKYKMTLILEDLETGQVTEVVKGQIVSHVHINSQIPHKPIDVLGKTMPVGYELDGDATIDISAKWEVDYQAKLSGLFML